MINPTGKDIRYADAWGRGHYGASRDHNRRHKGVDYLCEPGQQIRAPVSGRIVRKARPYAKSDYSGVLIQGEAVALKIFYFEPDVNLIGCHVEAGQVIGIAQDISKKYGEDMLSHIHIEAVSLDVSLFIDRL